MYNNSQLLKNTDARMWLSRQLKRIHIYELKLIMPWLVGLCVKNHNIGDDKEGHVQARSVLGPIYDHTKGNRKLSGKSPEARV